MRILTKKQLIRMNDWIQTNARPYDRAKWNYLFNGGSKDAIVEEMLKYQNADGGMGSGFEADVLCPLSFVCRHSNSRSYFPSIRI